MGNKSEKSLLKHGSNMSLLVFGSRILGLIRQMTMSSFLGTGPLADAFTTAFMLPNLFRRLFAENSITVAFIPTFNEYLTKLEKSKNDTTQNENKKNATDFATKETRDFLNSIFTLVSFGTTIVVVLGIVFAPIIIQLFFEEIADYHSAVLLTRIMFPYLLLISIAAFFQGILNSVKIFAPSAITPILFNILVISSTFIFTKTFGTPAGAMAYGVILGGLTQAVFQLPFVLKTGFKFNLIKFSKATQNPGTKKVLRLILPTIIGTAAYQINDLVSTSLGTKAGVGVAASLQYSLRLQELLLGIFAVSIGTVILPDLSQFAIKKKWQEFEKLLLQAIKIITLITIPATFFALLNGENIIILIYKSNQFNSQSVQLTLGIFKFHIIGLFAIAVNRILAPAFYAQKDTKSPTIAGVICVIINVLLAIILLIPMAGNGIAFALSIASFSNTIILFVFLKRNKNINMINLILTSLKFIIKMLVFSVIASLPLFFFKSTIYGMFSNHHKIISQGIPLFASFIIFAIIGISLLIITKDKTVSIILKKLKR